MPTFRFEFREDRVTAVPGIELPTVEAARDEALRCARDMLVDATLKGETRDGWAARVFSDTGELVVTVDFADVVLHGLDDVSG
jgi:hypothetical protein